MKTNIIYKSIGVNNFGATIILNMKKVGDRNKTLSKHYLKKSDMQKIQLTITNNFISSMKIDDKRVMYLYSNNTGIMISDEAYEVTKKFFDSLKKRYQNNFESMKGSEFALDQIHLLYHDSHKINHTRSGSHIDPSD